MGRWRREYHAAKLPALAKPAGGRSETCGLTPEAAAELLLTILHNDMQAIVERYMTAQRKQIVAAFENWWDKYRV
ncbi:hypothetical protein, partial [Methylobacterium nigriterrae]|uniref:hypothetical protein n=1 Tax=Methylobacterium nigriterrae TaxID=3127512 RepID=UPI003013E82A